MELVKQQYTIYWVLLSQKYACIIGGFVIKKFQKFKKISYIFEKINLMKDITGIQFIKFIVNYREIKNLGRADEIINRFKLDPLMQNEFMSLVLEEKNHSKMILISLKYLKKLKKTMFV